MKLSRNRKPWFVLAMAVTSIAAFAESPTPGAGTSSNTQQWTTADKDGDGMLSWEELLPFPAFTEDFNGIDADHNGKITRVEYASWREARKTN
jgi:hypothetical protein